MSHGLLQLSFGHKILKTAQNKYTQSIQNKKMTCERVSQIFQKVNIFRVICQIYKKKKQYLNKQFFHENFVIFRVRALLLFGYPTLSQINAYSGKIK